MKQAFNEGDGGQTFKDVDGHSIRRMGGRHSKERKWDRNSIKGMGGRLSIKVIHKKGI